jgi:starch-binding outer membrane protein, SusD/RagB family
MKKRYSTYGQTILFTALVLGLGACKKDGFLNVPPVGSLTNQTTFASQANADLFVNDIYSNLPNINNEDEILDQYTDNDFVGASWMTGQSVVRSNSMNPNNVPGGPAGCFNWGTNYANIRKCNVFLQQAALAKANFDTAWYRQRVGEVTFLRAFFYSLLYTNYGGVPIITTPLNDQSGDSIFIPRSTATQTAAFIEADCDTAAMDLPLVASESGRPTWGSAITLKGWIQLFFASPLSNPGDDVTPWAAAAATNLSVINSQQYSLFPDFGQQFLSKNNWNAETIFARGYATPSNGHRREGLLGPVIVHGTEQAWGNLAPTQNLVDDYEMDNGLPITDPTSGYDPQHPYVNRELRFYESIVYDSSEWQGDTWESRIGGNNQIDLGSTSDISNTGYNGKKTLDESINGQSSLGVSPGTSNYNYYRYAEVLLSYAEAQNEAVGPDATVYSAINLVRTRATLPNLPPGLTQAQMRTDIRRERRIELAFEDKRWYDIRRWDITTGPTGVLTTPEYGMLITPQANGTCTYAKVNIFNNTFSEYMNWLPIPQSVLDQNSRLVQNPGY